MHKSNLLDDKLDDILGLLGPSFSDNQTFELHIEMVCHRMSIEQLHRLQKSQETYFRVVIFFYFPFCKMALKCLLTFISLFLSF